MRLLEEDVEATAKLMSKYDDDHVNTGNISLPDTPGEPSSSYISWYTRYSSHHHKQPSTFSRLWDRIRSISLTQWYPFRKLSLLSPRYIVLILVTFSLSVILLLAHIFHLTSSTTEFCTTWPVDEHGNYHHHDTYNRVNGVETHSIAPSDGWQKPKGVEVIGMVFFGRRRYVDILDCYLQQNLASNGGYFDEVWFMIHTENDEDLVWLNSLVAQTPGYKVVNRPDCSKTAKGYACLWEDATADNTIYIKIDDDIIYIHPDTVPQLVHTRIAVPHAFGVSAHLVNSPMTGLEQYHHNAIYPFVPDPHSAPNKPKHSSNVSSSSAESWRPSEIARFPQDQLEKHKQQSDKRIMYPSVPYRGHPFVLLSEDNADLVHTSMGRYDQDPGGEFIAWGPIWRSWAMAAQQQYSLLYNIEKNRISRYFFGQPAPYASDAIGPDPSTTTANITTGTKAPGGEQIYDTQFRRYNLNFVAVWGSDIRANLPLPNLDDENAITHLLPGKTGRPFIVDTRAIAAHFSFHVQLEGVGQTDLLDRWRALANEAVCAPRGGLKVPWEERCPGF